MNKIEVKILNPEVLTNIEQMMVCAARLTQRGHNIHSIQDFMDLYNKSHKETTTDLMNKLPHNTIKRFGVVNIVVVGASRRFLAQITRAQVGITFTSASLQYSNYSGSADFVVPYNILKQGDKVINEYLDSCKRSMINYESLIKEHNINHDEAGYAAPQGLRNILIIGANVTALQHLISQRGCSRNTLETQYIVLKIWEELYKINPILFSPETTGPFCQKAGCKEGSFTCGRPIKRGTTPTEILKELYPELMEVKDETKNN